MAQHKYSFCLIVLEGTELQESTLSFKHMSHLPLQLLSQTLFAQMNIKRVILCMEQKHVRCKVKYLFHFYFSHTKKTKFRKHSFNGCRVYRDI